MDIPQLQPKGGLLSWLKKPGSWLTAIMVGAAGFIGIRLLDKILPWLTEFMWKIVDFTGGLLAAVIGIVIAAFVAMLVLDKRFWLALVYFNDRVAQAFLSLVWKVDPLGAVRTYSKRLGDRIDVLFTAITQLRGAVRDTTDKIENLAERIIKKMSLAAKAKETGRTQDAASESSLAGQLERFKKKLETLLVKMQALLTFLEKLHAMSNATKLDIDQRIEIAAEEYETVGKAYRGFQNAMAILRGGPEKMIFDEAMKAITEDINEKMGTMEAFLSTSDELFRDFDLNKLVEDDDAMRRIDEWTARLAAVTGEADAANQLHPAAAVETVTAEDTDEFRKLLRRRK